MRDIVVALVVFGLIPMALFQPYIGVLLWSWISYMNPHRLAYGFAYDFPFAAIVAVVTLASLFFSREPKRITWDPITILLGLFILWMTVTSVFSFFPDNAWPQWEKIMKIQLMTFIILIVMTSEKRLKYLVWVIALSIGFYGVKGGIFAILTGGEHRVWGPLGSFIQGNNELALALIMIIPLLRYLQMQYTNRWLKLALGAAIILCTASILASYSRGALLALVCMVTYLWWKSSSKVIIGIIILTLSVSAIPFMPDKWFERMDTIDTYEEDESAMGRIYAWKFAFNLAKDNPIVGGGFWTFNRSLHDKYAPHTESDTAYIATDAHSIYFKVLGEHGFVGLAIFLALLTASMRAGTWIRKKTRDDPELKWAYDLASMIQVSIVGYATGGVFLGLTYYDLYYNLIIMLAIVRSIVKKSINDKHSNAT